MNERIESLDREKNELLQRCVFCIVPTAYAFSETGDPQSTCAACRMR